MSSRKSPYDGPERRTAKVKLNPQLTALLENRDMEATIIERRGRRPLTGMAAAAREEKLRQMNLGHDLNPLTTNPLELEAQRKIAMDPTRTVTNPGFPVVVAPTGPGNAVVSQPVTKALSIVAIVLAAAQAASLAGALPKWVADVSGAALGVLVVFGISSPGIRKQA